jgi:hypothetical protein
MLLSAPLESFAEILVMGASSSGHRHQVSSLKPLPLLGADWWWPADPLHLKFRCALAAVEVLVHLEPLKA